MASSSSKCFLCDCSSNLSECIVCGLDVCSECKPKSRCKTIAPKTPLGPQVWCLGQFTREGPPFAYSIDQKTLIRVFSTLGVDQTSSVQKKNEMFSEKWGARISGDLVAELIKNQPIKKRIDVFNALRKYEIGHSEQSKKLADIPVKEQKLITSPFENLRVVALFFQPLTEKYFSVPLVIKPSLIEAAGMGVFAEQKIPKGAFSYYRGLIKSEDAQNGHYTWIIREWDRQSGFAPDDADTVYYTDATDLRTSNWCRYVNCPSHGVKCNIQVDQYFGHVKYVASEDISPGDELYIDYGPEYRFSNIKIKTRRYNWKARCATVGNTDKRLGHLLDRMESRGKLQDVGFPNKERLPRMNLFECTTESCPGKGKYFFCDGCERAHPLMSVDLFCDECSKMFCLKSRELGKGCHDPL